MDAPTCPRGSIITIDGPAGAGKSTVARRLADRLGMQFLDTGAMYRGVAAAALDAGIHPADADAVAELAEGLRLDFDWASDPPRLSVDGRDATDRLRDADVTTAVSEVATNPRVRERLVEVQRRIGLEHPYLVTEGRDQGSVVFPAAPVKFFLDASAEVRAERRAAQLRAAGHAADASVILREIRERDQRDSSRRDGPLIRPPDAIVIDSSHMTQDQVVAEMAAIARRKLPDAPGGEPDLQGEADADPPREGGA